MQGGSNGEDNGGPSGLGRTLPRVAWIAGWVIAFVILVAGLGGIIYASYVGLTMDTQPPESPPPRHLIIGLDLSQGNPLVKNGVFSQKAGRRIGQIVADLPFRSKITLRTFGSYALQENPLTFDRVISRRHPAEQVGAIVEGIVSGVPQLVDRGRLKAQVKSNILPFLYNMAGLVECSAMETDVILITDGVEDSELARLVDQEQTLPLPDRAYFDTCGMLEILGLGQGLGSYDETQRLRVIWDEWAMEAGFQSFRGLNDW